MTSKNSNDPLEGVTLQMILSELVGQYGWEEMGKNIEIRCFTHEPSIQSSLKFLRRTPWARDKVEEMYLRWMLELSGQAAVPGHLSAAVRRTETM